MTREEDIMDLCRLCLRAENVEICIFDEQPSEEKNILFKMSMCLPVKVLESDGLPKRICLHCYAKVDLFYQFWEESLKAESHLNSLLANNKSDNNNTNDQQVLTLDKGSLSINNNNNDDHVEEVKRESVDPEDDVVFNFDDEQMDSTAYKVEGRPEMTLLDETDPLKRKRDKPSTFKNVDEDGDPNRKRPRRRKDNHSYNDNHNSSAHLFPIVELKEGNWLHNDTISNPSAAALKNLGYKNPFIYPELKNKKKSSKKLESWNNNKWQCMICSDVKVNKTELMEHYESHKEETEPLKGNKLMGDYFICPVCLIDFTSLISYEKHVELNHGEKRYNCEICHKAFKNLYSLSVHNHKRHNTEKTFKCSGCDFEVDELKSLRSHIRDIHEKHVKYRCEICNKGFSTLSWYQEHKNFHTGAMPFECEICLKSFPYTRYLIAHKKNMHPEMFPTVPINHECEICNKKFAHKKSLILHLRGHTGESAVLCDMCGKSLSSAEHLKQHLRIHTGYKPHCCSVCGKGFAKKCNLTLHERVHSGEKPHICNVCGKGFSQRSTLVIHGRYHSGERPYQCQICHKGFVAKGLLGVHMKTCLDVSD